MVSCIGFQDVSLSFSSEKVLFNNFNLLLEKHPEKGKVIALMGPSGIGKSTIFNLLLNIVQSDSGNIIFPYEDMNIGYIPQRSVIFEQLSIKENLECLKYSNNLGKSFDRNKLYNTVNALNINHILSDKSLIQNLSGGEAQRIMLARSQSVVCNLLLMDEPCSFLDNHMKASFLYSLRETIDKNNLFSIMISHIWDEVKYIADQVVFLQRQSLKTGVSAKLLTINEAEKSPPSLGAMFSIHWPRCIEINIDDIPQDLSKHIPKGVASLGVFYSEDKNLSLPDGLRQYIKDKYIDQNILNGELFKVCFFDLNGNTVELLER